MKKISLLSQSFVQKNIHQWLEEDDFARNFQYVQKLSDEEVECHLKIKDDMILAGLPYFFEVFNYFLPQKEDWNSYYQYEGMHFLKAEDKVINFKLPFSVALTGERIALNLLQHCSSVATYTSEFVQIAKKKGIEILDTRKTLPGLRAIEKYGVVVGGGKNHRFGQMDAWMIKDNHKKFYGGLKGAYEFFQSIKSFYNPLIAEIHDLAELKEAITLNINHVMLDNFSPEDIRSAVQMKPQWMSFEISGGIRKENIEKYLIEGVDAISIGALTYAAPPVDLSLKLSKKL